MPKNFGELTDWWEGQEGMNSTAKRLVVFAPDAYPWTDMNNHWSNAVQFRPAPVRGCRILIPTDTFVAGTHIS